MARQHLAISRKYCHECGRKNKFERNASPLGCGDFVLTIATFGLWLVPRYLLDGIRNPWRCADCGRREGRLGA